MNSDPTHTGIAPQALLEFGEAGDSAGTTCALLTPAIRAKLAGLRSGEVLEVRVRDASAREDVLSWSRLSGHAVLGMFEEDGQRLRFFLQKK